ncbi:MAG: hypothetical protein WCS86_03075 [Candidatus Paceibacterota bacterium]
MKKGITFVLLTIFLVFVCTSLVFADFNFSNSGGFTQRFFGGRIISTTAIEVEGLESFGYTCPMAGTSLSITPLGSPSGTPTSYFIPSYVSPKTRTTPAPHQLILGRYGGSQTTISCTRPGDPPDTKQVSLNTIDLFGTSRY